MSETVVDPEVADVLQNTNVDYFEEEENVTERPVDDGIKKTAEKEEKTLEEDDLRNKLNMQRAKREQLIELGLDPPETNKSPEQTQQSEPIALEEPATAECNKLFRDNISLRRHFGFKHRYAYKYLEIEDFTERPFGNTGRRKIGKISTKVAVKKRP